MMKFGGLDSTRTFKLFSILGIMFGNLYPGVGVFTLLFLWRIYGHGDHHFIELGGVL